MHMGVLAIGYFFAVAVIAGSTVVAAHRLHVRWRQGWVSAYTFYLACVNTLALVAVVQYVLAALVMPESALRSLQAAAAPLWATLLCVALYFAWSFMAQIAGTSLSRSFNLAYAAAWTAIAVVVAVRASASPLLFVVKTSTLYGGSAWALWRIRRLDDPLDRRGLRGFVLLFAAGCLAFDLAVRNVTAVVGVRTPDVAIALVQVTMNVPALLWLGRYLRQRALARPPQPLPPDLREQLGRLGLSSREADVVALIVAGLSHKDIAVRLTIAPDTVKKHAYRRLPQAGRGEPGAADLPRATSHSRVTVRRRRCARHILMHRG